MLLNAHSLHPDDVVPLEDSVGPEAMDPTMLNYVLSGEQIEDAGGIVWTWKRILTGKLFDTEGIWLPMRLLVIQGAQLATGVVLIFIAFTLVVYIANKAEGFRASLPPNLPDWAIE